MSKKYHQTVSSPVKRRKINTEPENQNEMAKKSVEKRKDDAINVLEYMNDVIISKKRGVNQIKRKNPNTEKVIDLFMSSGLKYRDKKLKDQNTEKNKANPSEKRIIKRKKKNKTKETCKITKKQKKTTRFQNPLKPKKIKQTKRKSSNCDHKNTYTDHTRGETVCVNCGMVMKSKVIDQGPEWRVFNESDRKKIRAGLPSSPSIYDKGLSTEFYPNRKDARGSPLSPKMRESFRRYKKWDNRNKVQEGDHRNFAKAFNELDRICSQLKLPRSIKNKAAVLYRCMRKQKLTDGCSINGVISACVYAVCRKDEIPIIQDELLDVASLRRKMSDGVTKKFKCDECGTVKICDEDEYFTTYKCRCGKVYTDLDRFDFEYSIDKERELIDAGELRRCFKRIHQLDIEIPTPSARTYVPKFTSELGLSTKVIAKANKLIKVIEKNGLLMGKNPLGIAGACLYIISKVNKINISDEKIGNVCHITDVTIKERMDEIISGLNFRQKFPNVFSSK